MEITTDKPVMYTDSLSKMGHDTKVASPKSNPYNKTKQN